MKSLHRKAIVASMLLPLTACDNPAPRPHLQVHIDVQSDGDFLVFKPTQLTVPTGAMVVVTFHHAGHIISQKHDWVVADKGEMPALLAQGATLASKGDGDDTSFIKPGDNRVIAATPKIGKGQTTTIHFIAPAPGNYPFFCSTPGHADTMRGVLHVIPE